MSSLTGTKLAVFGVVNEGEEIINVELESEEDEHAMIWIS